MVDFLCGLCVVQPQEARMARILVLDDSVVRKLVLYLGDFYHSSEFTKKEKEEVRQQLAEAVVGAAAVAVVKES